MSSTPIRLRAKLRAAGGRIAYWHGITTMGVTIRIQTTCAPHTHNQSFFSERVLHPTNLAFMPWRAKRWIYRSMRDEVLEIAEIHADHQPRKIVVTVSSQDILSGGGWIAYERLKKAGIPLVETTDVMKPIRPRYGVLRAVLHHQEITYTWEAPPQA